MLCSTKYDTSIPEFHAFLNKYPKLKLAREELQILYYYTIKELGPQMLLITDTYRPPKSQEKLLKEGKSEDKHSLHNLNPSHACDHVPLHQGELMWKDYRQMHFIYGLMYAIFQNLKRLHKWPWNIRCGMDWEMNNYTEDKTTLYDPGHIELRPLDYKPNS